MAKEGAPKSSQNKESEPIRSRDGREDLPEEMSQNLQDAVWAGLAQKMQEDKILLCKQYGHHWIKGPEDKMICKRCCLPKEKDLPEGTVAEETAENSVNSS